MYVYVRTNIFTYIQSIKMYIYISKIYISNLYFIHTVYMYIYIYTGHVYLFTRTAFDSVPVQTLICSALSLSKRTAVGSVPVHLRTFLIHCIFQTD